MTNPEKLSELKNQTTVILLSYGDRFQYLENIVARLNEIGVGHVLIVTNAVSKRTDAVVHELLETCDCLSRLDFPENRGSAGGFAGGIQKAMMNDNMRFLWLLDDDNLPETDCLDRLLAVWETIRLETDGGGPVLVPARPGQGAYARRLLAGVSWKRITPRPSSFYGFHLLHLSRYLKQIMTAKLGVMPEQIEPFERIPRVIPVGNGYYGGLLLPLDVIEKVGLPKEDLFIYGDDTEYTTRISRLTRMFMVGDAVVHDMEPSWYVKTSGNQYVRVLNNLDSKRIYYHVRNRVWIDCHMRKRSGFVYWINRACVYLILRVLRWTGAGTKERLLLIFRAIHDGERGDLGKNSSIMEG